jgi:hypothetical protein
VLPEQAAGARPLRPADAVPRPPTEIKLRGRPLLVAGGLGEQLLFPVAQRGSLFALALWQGLSDAPG